MILITAILPTLLIAITIVNAQPRTRANYIDEVVGAERAFRADVLMRGLRDGFLAHLADDGILFRPNAVNGPAYLRMQDSGSGLLEWEPVYADVSSAGDLAFTTGPWTLRSAESDSVVAAGFYATVWRRDGSGIYKAAIDHGVGLGRPLPVPQPASVESPAVPADDGYGKREAVDVGGRVISTAASKQLMQSERELAAMSSGRDWVDVFTRSIRYDAWFLRRGSMPLKGTGAIRAFLVGDPGLMKWSPTAAYVSRSYDLGYTYGTYKFARADSSVVENGNYVRVWRAGLEGWRIQFEMLAPVR